MEINEDDRNKINIQRLKVNKVNIFQALNVDDELLSELINSKVLHYNEAIEIMSAGSREERAKSLVNCLIARQHSTKNWYKLFRNLLIKRNYNNLVVFLDNTIIKKPTFAVKTQGRFSRNTQPQIEQIDSQIISTGDFSTTTTTNYNNFRTSLSIASTGKSSYTMNVNDFNEKDYEYLAKKFPPLTHRPIYLLKELEQSKSRDDLKQIELESEAFDLFKRVELFFSLFQSDQEAFKDSFFLDTIICKNLFDFSHPHLYMKYFRHLFDNFSIDLVNFFTDGLIERLKQEKILRLKFYASVDDLVNKLVFIQKKNEKFECANELLSEYLRYLDFVEIYLKKLNTENNSVNKENDTSKNALLASKFSALCQMVVVKSHFYNFEATLNAFNKALDFMKKSEIDERNVNISILYYGIGNAYLEEGVFEKAFEYLNKSLMISNFEDEILIELLASSSLCYSSKWLIKKSESLSILSIQIAKSIYGINHPIFIRAMLSYCFFSNEFVQDESTIKICEYTFNLAKRVYGYDSIHVAEAYKFLSKALTSNKCFKDSLYYEYAQRAFKIAIENYSGHSPKLISYQISLVSALQWRSINSDVIEIRKVNLNDAYNLCLEALNSCLGTFGENNFMAAKIYRLLGSLFYYMERDQDSEIIHKKSLDILQAALSTKDLHYLLAKSTLGVFYKMIGHIDEAVKILAEVVNSLDINQMNEIVCYCRWIPSIYSNLSESFRVKKKEDQASHYQKISENLKQAALNKSEYKRDVLNAEIYNSPPKNLNEFLKNII